MSGNNGTLPWQKFFDGLDPKDPIKVLAKQVGDQDPPLNFEVEFTLCAQLAMLRQLREINPQGSARVASAFQLVKEGPTTAILARLKTLREQVCKMCHQLDPAENATADEVVLAELCRQMERLSQNLSEVSSQLRRYAANGTNGTNEGSASESASDPSL